MSYKTGNSPVAAIVSILGGTLAFLLFGWGGVAGYVGGFLVGGIGVIVNMRRAAKRSQKVTR